MDVALERGRKTPAGGVHGRAGGDVVRWGWGCGWWVGNATEISAPRGIRCLSHLSRGFEKEDERARDR